MTAVKQNIQDLRMPFRNNRKKLRGNQRFHTVFCVCSSNYKKILLINPFDSPFYELLPLLIFASFIDFLPSLSLQLHTGSIGKGGAKESLTWDFQFQESLHEVTLHSLEPRLYPAKIGKWRPKEEPNMAYFETTPFFPTKDVVDVTCRILLIRQLWFSFRWRVLFIHGKY